VPVTPAGTVPNATVVSPTDSNGPMVANSFGSAMTYGHGSAMADSNGPTMADGGSAVATTTTTPRAHFLHIRCRGGD